MIISRGGDKKCRLHEAKSPPAPAEKERPLNKDRFTACLNFGRSLLKPWPRVFPLAGQPIMLVIGKLLP